MITYCTLPEEPYETAPLGLLLLFSLFLPYLNAIEHEDIK